MRAPRRVSENGKVVARRRVLALLDEMGGEAVSYATLRALGLATPSLRRALEGLVGEGLIEMGPRCARRIPEAACHCAVCTEAREHEMETVRLLRAHAVTHRAQQGALGDEDADQMEAVAARLERRVHDPRLRCT